MAFYRHKKDIEAFQLTPDIRLEGVFYDSLTKIFRFDARYGVCISTEGNYIVRNKRDKYRATYTFWSKKTFERKFRELKHLPQYERLERP